MRQFSSRAKTKWLAQSHIIRKKLRKDKSRVPWMTHSVLLSSESNTTPFKLRPKTGPGKKHFCDTSLSGFYGPHFPWSISFALLKVVWFHFPLKVFLVGSHPLFQYPLLIFTPSPATANCLWIQAGIQRQSSPFSTPSFLASLESLPSHKLRILGKVILLSSSKLSIWEKDRTPNTRKFRGGLGVIKAAELQCSQCEKD